MGSKNDMLEIKQLTLSYAHQIVLENLSISLEQGEIACILGPSGCGKTTLLRAIAGFKSVQQGSITINGNIVSDDKTEVPVAKRRIGVVFQDFALFPHMSVIKNVAYGLNKLPKVEAQKLAQEAIKLVGLCDEQDKFPHELSGGQQQRVAIARALALEPKIMLFDEVTSALDPELVDEVLNVLRILAEDTDTTMLTVTHEMNFAREFADRVLFFDKGQIVESGSPEDIFTRPKESRTRSFLKKFIREIA